LNEGRELAENARPVMIYEGLLLRVFLKTGMASQGHLMIVSGPTFFYVTKMM